MKLVQGSREIAEAQSIWELEWFRVSVGEDAASKGISAFSNRYRHDNTLLSKEVHFLQQSHLENNTSLRAYAHEKLVYWRRGVTGGFTAEFCFVCNHLLTQPFFSHLPMHLEMLSCEPNCNLNMIKLLVHMDQAKQNRGVCFFSFKGSK